MKWRVRIGGLSGALRGVTVEAFSAEQAEALAARECAIPGESGDCERVVGSEPYDARAFDLIAYLHLPEQVRAVEDLGSIESARRRLCPLEFQASPPPIREVA